MNEQKLDSHFENDDFDDEPFISVYHDLLKEYPGAANLPDEAASRAHIPILGKPLAHNAEGVGDSPAANSTSAVELPTPEPYVWDGFTVCDYQTDKYAEATNLEEAIAIRGERLSLKRSSPKTSRQLLKELAKSASLRYGASPHGAHGMKKAGKSMRSGLLQTCIQAMSLH